MNLRWLLPLVLAVPCLAQTPSAATCGNPQQPYYMYNNHFYMCANGSPTQLDTSSQTITPSLVKIPEGTASAPTIQDASAATTGTYPKTAGAYWNTTIGGTDILSVHQYGAYVAGAIGIGTTTTPTVLMRSGNGLLYLGYAGWTDGTLELLSTIATDGTYSSQMTTGVSACEASFAETVAHNGTVTIPTSLNCLPANSIIDGIVYRITTTLSGNAISSFTLGVTGTTAKFCSTQSTLTAGTTGVCLAQWGTAGNQVNTTAAPVVITENQIATAGAIRIIVYYHSFTPPTS